MKSREHLSEEALNRLADYYVKEAPWIKVMERIKSREATKSFPQITPSIMLSAECFIRTYKVKPIPDDYGRIVPRSRGRNHLLIAVDWLTELGYFKRQYQIRYGDEIFNLSDEEYKEARRTGILYYPDTDLRIHYWREKIEIVYEPTEELKKAL